MEVYRTEEEQVEALKEWWRENGRSVVIGVVLALAAVFGWRYWQDTTRSQAEAASALYQQMLTQLDAGEGREVVEIARRIIAEHATSPYAALASLSLAQQAVDQGDLDGAAAHLRWVMDNAKVSEVRLLAQVRLARVLIAQGRADEALQHLATVAGSSYTVLVEETKGDAYLAQGRRAEALQAYQTALAAAADVPAKQQMLRMKVDDLADAGVVAQ
ncbi:YfgM family protein [Sulfurivermis fontis]|uniref:YfgM family protein n=1 Tax=Sulfurivermis fontis TaxID=1972068 RepID=UPI000FD9DA0B|nr:tetratricopeptide repeat protein [Sulfurivermis fontis]